MGAEPGEEGTDFRVWAPDRRSVEVVLADRVVPLGAEPRGWFGGRVAEVGDGDRYRLRLDGDVDVADPASRWQPEGPHGPSEVVDPDRYRWRDGGWGGPVAPRPVFYELHVGTFTDEGTWRAAGERLPALAELGITVIELMPVADFPGAFGWGYDGVCLFAPCHGYGTPDEMRAFVDRAHGLGLGVVLDVVYNHLGPDGNAIPALARDFFSRTHTTDWGDAINFDGPCAAPVRSFYLANARHWIEEYHLDGFRFDATQDIHDGGDDHILAAVAREARSAARGRRVLLVAENEPQEELLVRAPREGGCGLDAIWNDDFHHSARVALTGRREAYYSDYLGSPQELVSAAKRGFLYQGQWYAWQGKRRGTDARGLPQSRFVNYLENHDQVANSAAGERLATLVGPARLRAMTALLLLMPGGALLFQGQEFGSTRPFLFFADHQAELARAVRRGRAEFLRQFPSLDVPEVRARLADPGARSTFEACVLDDREREDNAAWRRLHRDLLRLRHGDAVLGVADPDVDGAVLGPDALALRWFGAEEDRLLVLNLGRDLHLLPVPEPLLAPPAGTAWRTLWSSESPDYGGRGAPEPETTSGGWRVPGQSALVLAPERSER